MKKISLLFVLLLTIAATNANAQDIFTAWPGLGNFHGVMAATFHPAEKGNFEPVKQRSGELVDKAALLLKSDIPAKYNKPELKAALEELSKRTTTLNGLIMENAKDEKINKSLIQVHDAFHKIVGICGGEK
ncbi:MAG: hypothetical protein JWQ28_1353 [Pedobacter sp.]|jgi:hypothetical protein|nr:hypothetical protein [Pedobacter sp.]